MGFLSTQSRPTINHFSHQHPLHLDNHNPTLTLAPSSCSGCKVPLSQGLIYTCKLCNYHLHIKCSEMPRQIKHPFDQRLVFSLLTTPAYAGGVFRCDACGEQGNGFSYHCKTRGTDLHILCASMPLSITHRLHHHNLNLFFSPPYFNKSFSCNVCKGIGGSHWLYRCDLCGFDAHLSCGTNKEMPAQLSPTAQINLHQQAMAVPVNVPQPLPPPLMPAIGMPAPWNPHLQNHQPFNPMNHVNTGGMGPNNPITNGPQFTMQQTSHGQNPNAIIQFLQQLQGNSGSGGGGGGGNANAQLLKLMLSAIGNRSDQLLEGMMDGGGGGGLDLGSFMGGNSDVSSLLGVNCDLSSLLGGNVDLSSLLGGNVDLSSLWGFMGGFSSS